jgi:DNA-binding transcriptional ArsR family regulator
MKRSKTARGEQAAWSPAEDLTPMEDELLIADLETVRVVADPTRLRILELLVLEPQTVKRLAAALDLPQTKLYYHINLLEEHGLVRVVATRVVSGIIEKQYGATARSYRVDQSLLALSAPGRDDTVDLMLATILDGLRGDLKRGLAAGLLELGDDAPAERRVTIGRVPVRLTPERGAELHRRLDELIKEYCPNPGELGAPAPGTQIYQLFIAFFPAHAADEAEQQAD